MTRVTLLLLALSSLALGSGPAEEKLDGPDSIYTRWLADILIRWPASRPDSDGRVGLQLTCVATAADDRYVGMVQQMTVAAPLSSVEHVLDDVPHYRDLFPGVVDVRVLPGSRNGRQYVTVWEQRVPVFFLQASARREHARVGRHGRPRIPRIGGNAVYRVRFLQRAVGSIAGIGRVAREPARRLRCGHRHQAARGKSAMEHRARSRRSWAASRVRIGTGGAMLSATASAAHGIACRNRRRVTP